MDISYQDRDRGLIRCEGSVSYEPSRTDLWLGRNLSWFGFPMPQSELVDRMFLVDADAGRVVAQIDGRSHGQTADGQLALTSTRDQKTAIWDVPPRKPLWLIAALSLAWALVVGLVARLHRRLRAAPLIASSESPA
jgi:hypothetical protein